jgi:hypothetical protein
MRKIFAAVMLCCAFAGCGLIPKDLTERINRSQLKGSIDKPYTEVIKGRPDLRHPPVATEELPQGRRIFKHVVEFIDQDLGGYGPFSEKREHLRVVYFLVDADGTVKDWATLIYAAGDRKCWFGWCHKGYKDPEIEKLDSVVRTSAGQKIDAWRANL